MVELLRHAYTRRGYRFFERGDYNLNLFGVRHPRREAGRFDDLVGCICRYGGRWQLALWEATTDPGTYYLNEPMRLDGTAIMAPGQWRSLWGIGLHRGQYEALVQRGVVKVFRDNNGDGQLDTGDSTTFGASGINLHKAGQHSTDVGRWSAGCQVLARAADFEALMGLARAQVAAGLGERFTYTLFDSEGDPDLLSLFESQQAA